MNVLYQEMALLEYEVVRLKLDDRRAWQLVIAGHESIETSDAVASEINVRLGRYGKTFTAFCANFTSTYRGACSGCR